MGSPPIDRWAPGHPSIGLGLCSTGPRDLTAILPRGRGARWKDAGERCDDPQDSSRRSHTGHLPGCASGAMSVQIGRWRARGSGGRIPRIDGRCGSSRGHEFAPQIELHPFGIDGAERAEQNAPQRGSAVGADRDAKVSVTVAILRTRLRRASADSGERVVRAPTGCAHRAARARSLAVERRVEAKLHGVHQAHRRIAPRDAHAARSVGANAERPGGRGHRSAGRPSARVTSTRGASQTIASTGSSSRHPQQHRRRIRVLSPQEGPSAAGRAFAVEATARRVRRFSTLRGVAMTLPSRTRPSCANPSRRCP